MKTRILWISTAVALAVVLAVPIAFAQRERAFHGGPGGVAGGPMFFGHLNRVKEALSLTDQQVSDIRAIFQTLRQQNEPYRQAMHGTMKQVAQTLINNPNDVAAAQALIDQQTEAERAMKTNALNAASKALNVLTPDQRTKLLTLLQERMDRFGK